MTAARHLTPNPARRVMPAGDASRTLDCFDAEGRLVGSVPRELVVDFLRSEAGEHGAALGEPHGGPWQAELAHLRRRLGHHAAAIDSECDPFARPDPSLRIGPHRIAADAPVFVIAEIGNNHNGSLEAAFRLIDAAAATGANCAKFQMREMATLYGAEVAGRSENLGVEYVLDLLARFQLSKDDLRRCFDYTRARGLVPLCTAWDLPSADICLAAGLEAMKTASADFTNHELLAHLAGKGVPLLCSTGMCSESDIIQGVDLLHSRGARFALLHCNATYPAPFRDINLDYLSRLQALSGAVVGYSGHERDIFVAVAAVAKGARIIERHITLDRTLEGSDHKVSLLPDEFSRMVQGIRQVQDALGSDAPRRPSQGERLNRVSLGKSLFASRTIEPGEIVSAEMLIVRSPGQGLAPNRMHDLLGQPARRRIAVQTPFFDDDVADDELSSHQLFAFGRPWGIPVRHRDYAALATRFRPDFVEFHLSALDLDLDDAVIAPVGGTGRLVVHAPELFAGDHVLDLASPDDAYRARSLTEMARVIAKAKALKRRFGATGPIGIVCNVGGFSENGFLGDDERARREAFLGDSLARVADPEVSLWPQTMPPFPWHFGGQRFHNLFVSAPDIVRLCARLRLQVCLDTSHSKLACNELSASFEDFLRAVAPLTAHIHVADASGLDGEGLQIGDGEIDFHAFFATADQLCPHASFIPEIWQGHENEGAGFRRALTRLQAILPR